MGLSPSERPKVVDNTRRSSRFTAEERITILTMSANGRSVGDISRAIRRSESGVSAFLVSMIDTTKLASATIRAGAVILAERIVKRSNVREAIDVLSRPGIDVILPPANQGGGGGFNIQVSVGVASCGTVVKVEAKDGDRERELGEGQGGGQGGPQAVLEAQAAQVSRT